MEIPTQLQKIEFRFLKLRVKGKEPTPDSSKWQEKNFMFDDPNLLEHIEKGGNYGVIGGYGNLILVDADSEEIEEIAEKLPPTFTIKTGNPAAYKKHYFFVANQKIKPIRLTENKLGDLGDVRSVGQYVVAANSIHPTGGIYKVIKDIPIAYVTENEVREAFSKYIDKDDSTEFKKFPVDTKTRTSPYIRECKLPDYLVNNKLARGGTSKNWKLFRYVADILGNRKVSQEVYQAIMRKQGYLDGAIKGWAKLNYEGKLGKSSCKIMREYLQNYYPTVANEICEGCSLYEKIKKKEEIISNKDYSELQKNILMRLTLRDRDGCTELIVKEIKKNNSIYTTRDDIKSEMWIYKEGVYVPEGRTLVKEFCRKILGEAYTSTLGNAVIAKIETDTGIEPNEFFKQDHLNEIPVQNGVLNILTKELTDFSPEKIFFNKLPVRYDPASECPKIDQFLTDVLAKPDDKKVFYEIAGFGLLKEYKFEKAIMFVGNGRNGKSKSIELLKRLVGVENCCNIPLVSLTPSSFSISELFGKLFNLAGDLSSAALKDTGMFKALTGRDIISAQRKFLRDLIFTNYAKMIFACNDLPKVYDTSAGFWERWILIEFPYMFVDQSTFDKAKEEDKKLWKVRDIDIINKISSDDELSGFLNKALEGLDLILKKKKFSYTIGTQEIKEKWIRKSDSFMAFCMDYLEEDETASISKQKLRRLFSKYCKKHNVKGCSDKVIKITLQNNYGVIEEHTQEFGGSSFTHCWVGIRIKG